MRSTSNCLTVRSRNSMTSSKLCPVSTCITGNGMRAGKNARWARCSITTESLPPENSRTGRSHSAAISRMIVIASSSRRPVGTAVVPISGDISAKSHKSDRSSRISRRRCAVSRCSAAPRTIAGMPGTLVTLRHGQSTWNLENLFTGWRDVPLTEQGKAEAVAAGSVDGRRRAALRHVAHLGAGAGRRHAQPRPRRDGPRVAARAAPLAAQRAPLRRPAGTRQEGDRRAPRRRADPPVAAQLRRAAAAGRHEQPGAPGERLALPAAAARGAARQRVPRRRRRPRPPLLAGRDRPAAAGRTRRPRHRPRQLAAGPAAAPRGRLPRGDRRGQHPHRCAPPLRVRRHPRRACPPSTSATPTRSPPEPRPSRPKPAPLPE